ncbi:hypothetical protein SISSUDRAFT_1054833 [Sistotremastrum suecicum HHB10207 ss-3]|uniref:Uncharacterized protein n=1 Tax=Sistotremastrum suecicum HHB10207 ss-3 TaxID=1314776 RepID=A0A165Y7N6_9AGAM|nr:hypothetical protein SISSUDRAFT_1054833 [Sistotremastrum suecicum HHB10207 ss-3]
MTPVSESTNPSSNDPLGVPAESMIWQVNLATLTLTASWRTPGGGSIPLTIFHDLSFGDLDFTGDLNAFVNDLGDEAEPVSLTLLPNPI